MPRRKCDVRFTPKSGHVQRNHRCPLWANSGHVRRKKACPVCSLKADMCSALADVCYRPNPEVATT